jgi:hypothetical protein
VVPPLEEAKAELGVGIEGQGICEGLAPAMKQLRRRTGNTDPPINGE